MPQLERNMVLKFYSVSFDMIVITTVDITVEQLFLNCIIINNTKCHSEINNNVL